MDKFIRIKLSINDIKVGMNVSDFELSDIMDMHIILVDAVTQDDEYGDTIGKIAFIGKELDDTVSELFKPGSKTCHIYKSSEYANGDVTYAE